MKYAFISVSNKTNLLSLTATLLSYDIGLIASDGTATFLKEHHIPVQSVTDFLGLKPILNGRVKTLHSTIFASILADRENPAHLQDVATNTLPLLDFIIVDLYPFEQHQDIEHIDIGGIALIRAAAKNFKFCTVVADLLQYPLLIDELEHHQGETTLAFRQAMAANAFATSSRYDALINQWLVSSVSQTLGLDKTIDLTYGENPHQQAGFYNPRGTTPQFKLLQGKPLSYNNILDLDAGLTLISEFNSTATVIIKHTNPCGVALFNSAAEAIKNAFLADAKSAFGGIVILNDVFDKNCALFLQEHFVEVIAALDFTAEVLAILAQKKCRILQYYPHALQKQNIRSALNGFLIQDNDTLDIQTLELTCTTKEGCKVTLADVYLASKIVKQAKSNAIVIVKQGRSVSIAAGFVNRVDAVHWALEKAKNEDLSNAILASDGFFPFPDSIELIAQSGLKTIIQPGGSIRDHAVIDACNAYGICMLFSGARGFKH